METGISSFSLLAGVCDAIVALFTRESLCATRIFCPIVQIWPFFTSFDCFAFCVLVVSLLLLPGRGPHSWLGGVRSSSPAWIDVDAIIGDGPGFFCSMVTGLAGQSARGGKKQILTFSSRGGCGRKYAPLALASHQGLRNIEPANQAN